jgi:hypothetical protein
MSVVLLDHGHVRVTEIAQNQQRHSGHDAETCVGVPQFVKTDGRFNAGGGAGQAHQAGLVATLPGLAVTQKDIFVGRAAGCQRIKKGAPFICQHHVGGLPLFDLPMCNLPCRQSLTLTA